ncbi:MAG: SulP family inorganic anion transporter [Ignavibacteria bacterium]
MNTVQSKGTIDWSKEILSGFIVSLLALPLSLGIAAASDFPNPLYGVVTAIIGGMIVGLFSGARLTIKGPAAGLIVICAGSIAAFGGGEHGWQLTLGVICVAAVIQIMFGLLKLGKLSDFFPLAAVHGMLAAIGLIVISKQLHILMGVNPLNAEGKPMIEPFELIEALPATFALLQQNMNIVIVGVVSLATALIVPLIQLQWVKKIPTPMIVLAIAIPLGMVLHLDQQKGALLAFNKPFLDIVRFHVSFAGLAQPVLFFEYVVLFSLIGSLESLLTAKAIDMLDPMKRKSDYNRDLIAVGGGNMLSSILGGLPMIAEVARSTNNVNNGAKTKWANVFHGLFLLIFMLAMIPLLQLIPKASLAALLIAVGIKLAHPKEFIHMYKIGKEQLIIFVVTIICTLGIDLLVGIGAGIIAKFIINFYYSRSVSKHFSLDVEVNDEIENMTIVYIKRNAVFSNIIRLKKLINSLKDTQHLVLECSQAVFIDHTAMSSLYQLREDFEQEGRIMEFRGFEVMIPHSSHPLAARNIEHVRR